MGLLLLSSANPAILKYFIASQAATARTNAFIRMKTLQGYNI